MRNREPWHLWAQDGDAVQHIRQASVRFERSARAARAIMKYANYTVFLSHNGPDAPPPPAERVQVPRWLVSNG